MGRLLVVALAVTLAAGCGGGGKRLSKNEYASRADAICRKFNSLSQAASNPKSLPELARAVNKLTPLLGKSIKELQKLKPPANEQATADRWLDTVRAIRADLAKVADRAAKRDTQGVGAALQAGARDQQRGNQLASQLGMTDCSE